MAIPHQIYSLYKLPISNQHLLTRAFCPGYSNANANQERKAYTILGHKQQLLLEYYSQQKAIDASKLVLMGTFSGLPEGDALYEEQGTTFTQALWYVPTNLKYNTVYLSLAENEAAFWEATEEPDFADIGLTKEALIPPAILLEQVDFITDQDYDLSSIPHYNTIDLEDERRKGL